MRDPKIKNEIKMENLQKRQRKGWVCSQGLCILHLKILAQGNQFAEREKDEREDACEREGVR